MEKAQTTSKTLIFKSDCTRDMNDNYFEIGRTRVVTSPCGSYREAAEQKGSRFGYRFSLHSIRKPHLMIVRIPDDALRFICIQNGTNYDNTTGIMTGGAVKNTGRMLTVGNYFWPRWTDDSIVFTSYGLPFERPAAVSSFEIWELDELPEAALDKDCYRTGNRSFGIQYEDPCNIGCSEGAYCFNDWLECHIDYMLFTGQNRLVYPVNWYHGPIIPVKTQPSSRFCGVSAPDRRTYVRSTLDCPDWLDTLLTRFDEEGLRFTGSLTLLRLGNLMAVQNTDIGRIRDGADTINNMLWNGQVQTSTNDWTTMYNPIIFPQWLRADETGGPEPMVYSEKRTADAATPIFDPLHPEVRRQLIEYFTEIGVKYARHKSFEGLTVNFWHATLLWYGTLLAGYGDSTFAMFESETGIKTGADVKDPERFSKRFRSVMDTSKETFIAWRCKKIHALIIELRDALRRARPDLKLGINIWNEPSFFAYLPGRGGLPESKTPGAQFGSRASDYELYREGGIDLDMFKDDDGIELSVEHDCCRDRSMGLDTPERSHMLGDFAYLDRQTNETLRTSGRSSGFHFNCWVELWGDHKRFPCDPDDPNIGMIRDLPDFKASFIFRENSTYADDPERRFFFDEQLRIAAPFTPAAAFAEELTMDIALHDALSVTSGGLYLDKAHAGVQLKIANEFRKLPAVPFSDISDRRGPIAARYHCDGQRTFIYCVNREPYPLPVTVTFADGTLTAEIEPFMLKVWILDRRTDVLRAETEVPENIREDYERRAAQVFDLFAAADPASEAAHGIPVISGMMKEALRTQDLAGLRHLLNCYTVAALEKEKTAGAGR